MKKRRRTVRRLLCGLLALALLIPLSGPAAVVPASAVTQAQIDELKDQAAQLDQQREQLQAQLDAVRDDKDQAMEQKELLERQINATPAEIDNIQAQIDTLEQYKRSVVFRTVSQGITHAAMKKTDSNVWTTIPSNWDLADIKYLFEIVKRIAGKEGYDILSVTQRGLKVKDISSNEGQIANDYSGYQLVYPTDFVMNHMDLLTGWVDCSTQLGVTSPDYRVFILRDKERNNLHYFKYVMQCCYMCRIFYSLGQGVSQLGRWRLQTSSFNNFKVPVPPTEIQLEISIFLDTKIAEIDSIIDQKKEQLSILETYKKSLIYEYVTGKKEVPVQ